MTVRGAERLDRFRFTDMVKYARQDGLHQWHREFVWTLERNPDASAAFAYLLKEYEGCVDREDDDHDDWCRTCWPILWLLKKDDE